MNYTLGLDIGVNSIGWAIVESTETFDFKSLLGMGSRVFKAGLDGIETGKGKSPNAIRRRERLIRRQTLRKSRRLNKIFHSLQRYHLLPEGNNKVIFNEMDKKFLDIYVKRESIPQEEQYRMAHIMPYILREKGLSDKLSHYELGRALYHMAHRRGFKSNRKVLSQKNEKSGEIQTDINTLRMNMQGYATLGAYFASLNPEKTKIRQHLTARDMFEEEFDLLIEKQRQFHGEILTDEFVKTLRLYFFHQRPLKSQRSLIGKCSLETDPPQVRIGCYRPEFQRFRTLQNVNHLRIKMPDGTIVPLNETQRGKLLRALTLDGEIGHEDAKTLLGLKPKCKFTVDHDDEKKIIGDRTQAAMRKIFESAWDKMSVENQLSAITDMVSIRKEEVLYTRAKNHWNLSDQAAERMSRTILEEGYGYLSKKAILKLLPYLEKGMSYQEAVGLVYPMPEKMMLYDELPTLQNHHATDIRNPLVKRTLSQLRVVINAIIKKWGKPAKIRIELARDLKNTAKVRAEIVEKNKTREAENAKIKKMLCEERNFTNPSPDDILKVKLMKECRGICPYTGQIITMDKLFNGDFDIEHIIPLSRSLDNSFANKTLCEAHFNRHVKKNQTPHETLFHDSQKYTDMINRVRIWGSQNGKLTCFELDDEKLKEHLDSFTSRQLNDTRYATLEAVKYLSLLFGGTVVDGKRKIEAVAGGITALMRQVLDLNGLLNKTGENFKSRDDHRHHALDALVIALIEPRYIQRVSDYIQENAEQRKGHERFSFRNFPLVITPDFKSIVRKKLDEIIVSHGVNHRLRGKLHDGTIYAKKSKSIAHTPVFLKELKEEQFEKIVNDRDKKLILEKLKELGLTPKDAKKAFENDANLPRIERKNNISTPIRKVRIKVTANTMKVGQGSHAREVKNGENHHIEIIETHDEKGNVQWEGIVVPLIDAIWRKRRGEAVIQRNHGDGKRFLFSLMKGDILLLEMSPGKPEYFMVRVLDKTNNKFSISNIYDSRISKKIKKYQNNVNFFADKNCRKVTVHPLGEVRWAND